MMQSPVDLDRPVDLECPMLTEPQAYALAELCKRITWSDVRSCAVDDDEARLMIQATDRIRGALEQAGIYVR